MESLLCIHCAVCRRANSLLQDPDANSFTRCASPLFPLFRLRTASHYTHLQFPLICCVYIIYCYFFLECVGLPVWCIITLAQLTVSNDAHACANGYVRKHIWFIRYVHIHNAVIYCCIRAQPVLCSTGQRQVSHLSIGQKSICMHLSSGLVCDCTETVEIEKGLEIHMKLKSYRIEIE